MVSFSILESVTVRTVAGEHHGNPTSPLQSPCGVAVDENQTMYIADSNNHRIVAWRINATVGETLVDGNNGSYQFNRLYYPTDVLLDRETQSLFICDDGNRRVMRQFLDSSNNATSDDNDTMQLIIDNIDCGGLAMDKNGFLYVSDYAKHEVRRYKKDGDMHGTRVAGSNQSGHSLQELNEPSYLSVDDQANLYISDSGNHRVVKWLQGSIEGIVVAGGNGTGNRLMQLSYPRGISVSREGDVYVVDSLNNRIMRWELQANQGMPVIADGWIGGAEGLSSDRYGHFYAADKKNNQIKLLSFSNIK